jgi:hypothetical protein
MFRDFWIDDFASVGLKCCEGAFLIFAHKSAVAGDIRCENGGNRRSTRDPAIQDAPTHGFLGQVYDQVLECVYRARNVRFGSKADICAAKSDVRFTPKSDRESGFCVAALHCLRMAAG